MTPISGPVSEGEIPLERRGVHLRIRIHQDLRNCAWCFRCRMLGTDIPDARESETCPYRDHQEAHKDPVFQVSRKQERPSYSVLPARQFPFRRDIDDPLPAFTFYSGIITFAIKFSTEQNFPLVIFTEKNLSVLTPYAWVHKLSAYLIFCTCIVENCFLVFPHV